VRRRRPRAESCILNLVLSVDYTTLPRWWKEE